MLASTRRCAAVPRVPVDPSLVRDPMSTSYGAAIFCMSWGAGPTNCISSAASVFERHGEWKAGLGIILRVATHYLPRGGITVRSQSLAPVQTIGARQQKKMTH